MKTIHDNKYATKEYKEGLVKFLNDNTVFYDEHPEITSEEFLAVMDNLRKREQPPDNEIFIVSRPENVEYIKELLEYYNEEKLDD